MSRIAGIDVGGTFTDLVRGGRSALARRHRARHDDDNERDA
jgi:N-methylhydantoinase A/oxoprolinase/acetone carboxylase beta subunit